MSVLMCFITTKVTAGEEILNNRESATVINDFESQANVDETTIRADFTEKSLNSNPEFIKHGNGSLRLFADNKADGKPDGYPSFTVCLKEPADLSNYRGLGFWVYTPKGVSQHFFGRRDITITMNDSKGGNLKNLGLVTPPDVVKINFDGTPQRALSDGWSYFFWDFKGLKKFPVLHNLTFMFGQIMETYKTVELYVDDIALYPVSPLDPHADTKQLAKILRHSQDWTKRYQALSELEKDSNPDSLKAQLLALNDNALIVRECAIKTVSLTVKNLGKEATETLKEMFGSDSFTVREAVLRIVADSPKAFASIVEGMLDTALTDDAYYVRHLAYTELLESGETPQRITKLMLKKLSEAKSDRAKIKCVRTLDMIGPEAKSATGELLAITRNKNNDFMLRAWALKAMWWIAEEKLTPQDLALGLQLKPGQIHRHILDIISKRLVAFGADALPVLKEKLKDANPQVRARAAALIGHMGKTAISAVPELKQLTKDKKWYVAWDANKAIEKITGKEISKMPAPPVTKGASDVKVQSKGDYTIIDNGLVKITFKNNDPSPGPVDMREPGGKNVVDGEWLGANLLAFYYTKSPAFREKQWLQKVWGSRFSLETTTKVVRNSADSAEFVYTFKDDKSPLIISYHYLVKKGLKGFYAYIVVKNISGKEMPKSHFTQSGEGVGRLNYLVALTENHFEYSVLHDMYKGPAKMTQGITERITRKRRYMNCTTRLPDGQIKAKHEWEPYELETPVTGYCGKNGGVWMVVPDLDFFFDSYPRWRKSGNYDNLFKLHLESKYSIGGLSSFVDADFEKIYGPMLFYMNDGENIEEMWTDAKRQADKEIKQWPYKWMDNPRYNDRGIVTGKVSFKDGTSPEGTYVILGDIAEDAIKDKETVFRWMYSKSPYNYYVKAKADGSFTIPNIQQGEYDLSIYKPGILGADLTAKRVKVKKGGELDVGTIEVKPYTKGKVIWRIGVPDGGAAEYKNGGNFHNWDNYERYFMDFPNGVNYTVGKSDYSKDWNYVQPVSQRGVFKPTTNTINFELKEIPKGKVVLSTVIAGRSPYLDVILNGRKIGSLRIKVNIGGQTLRSANYIAMVQREIVIPKKDLKQGMNKLQLTFAIGLAKNPQAAEKANKRWTSQIVYDYIQLEEQ